MTSPSPGFSCPGVPSRVTLPCYVPPTLDPLLAGKPTMTPGWEAKRSYIEGVQLAGRDANQLAHHKFFIQGGGASGVRPETKITRYEFIGYSWTPWGRSEKTESRGLEDLSLVLTQQCQFYAHLDSLIGWCRLNEGVIVAYSSFPLCLRVTQS